MRISRLVVGVCVGLALVSVAMAEPEVFSDAGFTSDQTFAVENDKLHVIYFTASWCPPCQKMKKTTWVDDSLVNWLNENAIVTAVDVDEYSQIAANHGVSAMPTMVVMRQDEEVARTVGYQGAVNFKDWLVRAKAGTLTPPVKEFALPVGNEIVDIDAKLDEARELVNGGELDEATKAYAWLWDNMLLHNQAFVGVRGSFMASDMERLAKEHSPAIEKFRSLRDREQLSMEQGDVTWDRLDDWFVLNSVIGDVESTLAWVERNVVERQNPKAFGRLGFRIQPLLVENKRYDILALTSNPVLEARRAVEIIKYSERAFNIDPSQEQDDQLREMLESSWRENLWESAGIWFTVALVDGDRAAAMEIAEMLIEKDDTPEMRSSLTNAAQEAGVEMIELPDK